MRTQLNIPADQAGVLAELTAIAPRHFWPTRRDSRSSGQGHVSQTLGRQDKRWLHLNRHNEFAVLELVRLVTADLARRYRGYIRQIDLFDFDSCESAEAYERYDQRW